MRLLACSATILINTVFICNLREKQVAFPDKLSALICNDMTFFSVKTRPANLYSHRQIEICFANLFDVLVLLRLHLSIIIITQFQTTFSQNASGELDINSAYRMENLFALRDKVTIPLFSDKKRQIKFARALHRDSFVLRILPRKA